jgi:hypothetical protein
VRETKEDLVDLQRLLDESYSSAGVHLRSIFVPEGRCSAAQLVEALPGVFTICLATVTAHCEPLVAPVDGLFYRGRLWFSLPPGAVRARHLRERRQTSATYVDGEFCLIVHGKAREIVDGDRLYTGWVEYVRDVYGPAALEAASRQNRARSGPDFTGYVEARRMYAKAPRK